MTDEKLSPSVPRRHAPDGTYRRKNKEVKKIKINDGFGYTQKRSQPTELMEKKNDP